MSSWAQESSFRRRVSQRRRLKMLRNLDQYKISNPFRFLRGEPPIPDELSRQLKKIEYLSSTSISMLSLPSISSDSSRDQTTLIKMAMALQQQENRFREIFGESVLDYRQVELDQYSHSQEPQPTHPSQGSEAIQTKDEMPLNIYQYEPEQFHQSLFESRLLGGEQLRIMQSEQVVHKTGMEAQVVAGQDFEQYFIS